MLEGGAHNLKAISQKKHKSGRETALSNFYSLWEFDLDQTDLTRKEAQSLAKPQRSLPHVKENVNTILP